VVTDVSESIEALRANPIALISGRDTGGLGVVF